MQGYASRVSSNAKRDRAENKRRGIKSYRRQAFEARAKRRRQALHKKAGLI